MMFWFQFLAEQQFYVILISYRQMDMNIFILLRSDPHVDFNAQSESVSWLKWDFIHFIARRIATTLRWFLVDLMDDEIRK